MWYLGPVLLNICINDLEEKMKGSPFYLHLTQISDDTLCSSFKIILGPIQQSDIQCKEI